MSDDVLRVYVYPNRRVDSLGPEMETNAVILTDEDYTRLRAEVERLKDDLRKEWLVGYEEAHGPDYVPIPREKIDAAWERTHRRASPRSSLVWWQVSQSAALFVLRKLGIVACQECGGSGIPTPYEVGSGESCHRCHGHGWIREERGDE